MAAVGPLINQVPNRLLHKPEIPHEPSEFNFTGNVGFLLKLQEQDLQAQGLIFLT